jgi:hypothetical protein
VSNTTTSVCRPLSSPTSFDRIRSASLPASMVSHRHYEIKRTAMDLHVISLLLVIAGATYLMTTAGLSKRGLEWKRRSGICPSCGRDTRECSCRR